MNRSACRVTLDCHQGRQVTDGGRATCTQGEIHCEQPNASLYTFTGNLVLQRDHIAKSGTLAMTPASILLRGSCLRNTKSVLGAIIFAGHETKACNAPDLMDVAHLSTTTS